MKKVCNEFVPFVHDLEVCDTCGHLSGKHPLPAEPDGLVKAMWAVLLDRGGIWNYYAGEFDPPRVYHDGRMNNTAKMRTHMINCKINWKETGKPVIDETMGVFTGTFCSHQEYATAIVGKLTCKCDEYFHQEIGIQGITIGQLIWEVVHAED